MIDILKLNFDGLDGETSWEEEARGLVPADYVGNCQLDTSQSYSGSGSVLFPGGSLNAFAYDIATLPLFFDLDVHFRFTANPDYLDLVYTRGGAARFSVSLGAPSDDLLIAVSARDREYNDVADFSGSIMLAPDTWHKFCLRLSGRNLTVWINDAEIGTWTAAIDAPYSDVEAMEWYTANRPGLNVWYDAIHVWTNIVEIPSTALLFSTFAPQVNVYEIPLAVMNMAAMTPYRHVNIPRGLLAMACLPVKFGSGPYAVSSVMLSFIAIDPAFLWFLSGQNQRRIQTIYQCVLTGAADWLDDLVVPMASFQATIRRGDVYFVVMVKPYLYTYGQTPDAVDLYWLARYPLWTAISVNVPNITDYIADIAARSHGDVVIRKGYKNAAGEINLQEICRGAYESIAREKTPFGYSATLSASRVRVQGWSKRRDIENIHEYGVDSEGMRKFRTAPDLFLNIGDTMNVPASVSGEDTDSVMLVGEITYAVNTMTESMEITEGADPSEETEPEADPTVDQWETQQANIELYGVKPYPQY